MQGYQKILVSKKFLLFTFPHLPCNKHTFCKHHIFKKNKIYKHSYLGSDRKNILSIAFLSILLKLGNSFWYIFFSCGVYIKHSIFFFLIHNKTYTFSFVADQNMTISSSMNISDKAIFNMFLYRIFIFLWNEIKVDFRNCN